MAIRTLRREGISFVLSKQSVNFIRILLRVRHSHYFVCRVGRGPRSGALTVHDADALRAPPQRLHLDEVALREVVPEGEELPHAGHLQPDARAAEHRQQAGRPRRQAPEQGVVDTAERGLRPESRNAVGRAVIFKRCSVQLHYWEWSIFRK